MARRAWTRCSPEPKLLLSPRIRTATVGVSPSSATHARTAGCVLSWTATVMATLLEPGEIDTEHSETDGSASTEHDRRLEPPFAPQLRGGWGFGLNGTRSPARAG